MFKNSSIKLCSLISALVILVAVIFTVSGCKNEDAHPENSTNQSELSSTEQASDTNTTEPDTSEIESSTETTVPSTKKNHVVYNKPTESTTNDSPAYINELKVISLPSKTTYYIGDEFSLDGLKVQAYYTNGSSRDATLSVSFYPMLDTTSAGTKTIHLEEVDEFTNLAHTSFKVVVKTPSITLSKTNVSLNVNEQMSINAIVEPEGCTVQWFSSSPNVATVDSNGCITAVGSGTASIYATITYNDIQYTSDYCTVEVKAPEPSQPNSDVVPM